jgi:pimeloyl-ACP methyl ester carboxylesterase
MARAFANGLDFHVSHFRSGPPGDRPVVVCVHGLAVVDNAATSLVVGFHLATKADVYVYDLRGHGRSEKPPSGYTVADHAGDLLALLDALGLDQPVHLVGFSYGGAIAMVAAMRAPGRAASVSLFDGLVPVAGWEKDLFSLVREYLESEDAARARGVPDEEVEQAVIEQSMQKFGLRRRRATGAVRRVRELYATTTLRADMDREPSYEKEDFARIDCPVLGIYGDRSECYWLTDLLPGLVRDLTLHTIVGADHLGVFWRPDETRPLLSRFLGLDGPA